MLPCQQQVICRFYSLSIALSGIRVNFSNSLSGFYFVNRLVLLVLSVDVSGWYSGVITRMPINTIEQKLNFNYHFLFFMAAMIIVPI